MRVQILGYMRTRSVEVIFRIMDMILDKIEGFSDYFVYDKKITLSETFLFVMSLGRAIWFTAFGVNMGGTSGPLVHEVWIPIFWLVSIAHFVSFFFPSLVPRIATLLVYSLLWISLSILAWLAVFSSPAVPTFASIGFMSAFIAVRLLRERRND